MTKILVTGASGQLGSELQKISGNYPSIKFFFTDVQTLDITDINKLELFFNENKPEYLINCAAYTAVDNAETDIETAEILNIDAVAFLAITAEKHDCKIIHFSTDYVYSGSKQDLPYTEEDVTNPQSEYGRTKLHGEQMLDGIYNSMIIRTSWLYSGFGNNFVKTMLRLGKEKTELKVVFDQVGTPTYAGDLAKATMQIIEKAEKTEFKPGIYNYSNEGVCSWYDFAHEIMEIAGLKCKIIPIESSEFPQKAKRPQYSILNKKKIKNTFNIEIPYWKDSLKICMEELKN